MIKVRVCMGTHCSMMGNLNLFENLEEIQQEFPEELELEMVKCLKLCDTNKTPIIYINDKLITSAKSEEVIAEILEMIKK